MSKLRKTNLVIIFVFVQILQLFNNSFAQDIEAKIKTQTRLPAAVSVEGKFLNESKFEKYRHFSFLRSIAGLENLGARISGLNLFDIQEQKIPYKKLTDGEFLAENEAAIFSYNANLDFSENLNAMAHISWLSEEQGILMTDDLFPQFSEKFSADISFELPDDWKIISTEKRLNENSFYVQDVRKAVFLIGKNWRAKPVQIDNFTLNFVMSGEWLFSDAEALAMAEEIFREYKKTIGESPAAEKAQIFLINYPTNNKPGRWEAETRGSTVTIISTDMPFKTQSVQRLHEQLRHELFHLWIPNNLALTGNYDWFYEGFALYQSLRTGLAVNRIRFEDFLATLSHAYNFTNLQKQQISLIEASENRWRGANSQIYARGILAAFLCDVAILRQSKGKRSITEIYREIYKKHRVPGREQAGNTAILSILEGFAELRPVVDKYIKGAEKIDWRTDLESIGIEAAETNFTTSLQVKTKLNGRQKDLLDRLGYNNWRKNLDRSR